MQDPLFLCVLGKATVIIKFVSDIQLRINQLIILCSLLQRVELLAKKIAGQDNRIKDPFIRFPPYILNVIACSSRCERVCNCTKFSVESCKTVWQ